MSRFPAPLRLALLIMLTLAVSLPLVPGCEATEAGQSTAATAADSNTANLAETIPTVASATAQADGSSFQNVILLIGDGMGTQHVELGRLVKGKPMVFDDWPVRGLLDTAPHRAGIITDSAAAATAMATGMRTANGRISIGPDGERLSTIMQRFQQKGARVGLVATKSITDATPAAFVANVNSRREEAAIARQMLAAQPDVLLGGGWSYIGLSLGAISGQPAQNAATQAGYQLVRSVDQLKAFDPQKSPRLLGVFATLHMDYMVDRTADTDRKSVV